MKPFLYLLTTTPFIFACGEDASPPGTTPPTTQMPVPGLVTTTTMGDLQESSVDAMDAEAWVYVSLREGGIEVEVSDPASDTRWDLGFRRSNIRVNGGASGAGNGAVALVRNTTFTEIDQAPAADWHTDEPAMETGEDGSPVMNDGVDFAFTRAYGEEIPTGWYSYDPSTHVLTPQEVVWVLRTPDNGYFALGIVDWYDEAGTSGLWTLNWKAVLPPTQDSRPGFEIDASSREAPVYVDLAAKSLTTGGPDSTSWDLAFSRTTIRTNSGVSGPGFGGARETAPGTDFASASTSPTSGFEIDAELPVPGPPGSGTSPGNPVLADWFDYDPATHEVSPKATWFLVRGAKGETYKLRINSWEDGVYTLEVEALTRTPDIVSIEVDASSLEAPTFVSARLGRIVTATASDQTWDLAFTRTVLQTNSGVSGPGDGGAALLEAASLESANEPPSVFEIDTMIPSSRPGLPPYAGNLALADWFNYDPVSHVVTPKARVHALRTADGGLAAFVIDSYLDGVFTLRTLYAGAAQDRFQ